MGKYNSYAANLNALFRNTVEQYNKLCWSVEAAERAAERGSTPAQKEASRASLRAAKETFNRGVAELFAQHECAVDKLTAEVKKAVADDDIVNPSDIDANAMELLKSGIMGVSDYAAMLDRYNGNKTMLRLIGKYADNARQSMTNTEERQRMAVISMSTNKNGTSVVDAWENLAFAAKTYSGKNNPHSASYVHAMQRHWDDANIQNALRDF